MVWKWKMKEGIKFITLDSWAELGADVAFSARWGGVSPGSYQSLNMGFHVGDEKDNVLKNREKFLRILGLDLADTVSCQQVHGHKVARVSELDKGKGAFHDEDAIEGSDGMVTNHKGLYLMTFYADCIPIMLFDSNKQAVGMVHSGWKGTMARIGAQAVKVMAREYDSQPRDLFMLLGPGINSCCFEIQSDLAEKAQAEFPEYNGIINKNNIGSYFWDLRKTIKQSLLEQGIPGQNIVDCDLCTCCNTDTFYSYRGEGGKTGRICSLVGLKK